MIGIARTERISDQTTTIEDLSTGPYVVRVAGGIRTWITVVRRYGGTTDGRGFFRAVWRFEPWAGRRRYSQRTVRRKLRIRGFGTVRQHIQRARNVGILSTSTDHK